MSVPEDYPHKADLLTFAKKTTSRFIDLVENEITDLTNIKTQFGLVVKFSIVRNNENEYMEHYFKQNEPLFLTETTKKQLKTPLPTLVTTLKAK